MAESKVKVSAVTIIDVKVGEKQNCWGVEFTCVGDDADPESKRLEASIGKSDADAMIKASRVVKA